MELRPSLNRYFSVSEGATSIQPTLTQCSLSSISYATFVIYIYGRFQHL